MSEARAGIELYVIRHGETELNLRRDIIAGRSNHVGLTTHGEDQARQRGWQFYYDRIRPDIVFSSPAVRCRETARLCLEAMGCEEEPIIDDRLQEASQGVWEGRLRASVYTETLLDQVGRLGMDFRAPGGDSINDVAERKLSFIHELPERFEDEKDDGRVVFVFGHGLSTRVLAGSLLGWSMDEMRQEITPNASTSLFTYDGHEGWRVKRVGELVIAGA